MSFTLSLLNFIWSLPLFSLICFIAQLFIYPLPTGFCFIPPSVFSLLLIFPSLSAFPLFWPDFFPHCLIQMFSLLFQLPFLIDLLLTNPLVFFFLQHFSPIPLSFICFYGGTKQPSLYISPYSLPSLLSSL